MSVRKVNEEVFHLEERIPLVGIQEVNFLKQKVNANERKRVRLCAHRSIEDQVQEMFVALTRESYIRPHKHLHKSESFHIVQGMMELIIFDDEGNITDSIRLADPSSGGRFYHRLTDPAFHTLRILSDFLVFHETTSGPFEKAGTLFAPWSPEEHDRAAVQQFMALLLGRAGRFAALGRKS